MDQLITRASKGEALTHADLDGNWDIIQAAVDDVEGTLATTTQTANDALTNANSAASTATNAAVDAGNALTAANAAVKSVNGQEPDSFGNVDIPTSPGTETDLTVGMRTATTMVLVSSSGDDATLPSASSTEAGLFPAAAQVKLAALPDNTALTASLAAKQADLGLANVAALDTKIDGRADARITAQKGANSGIATLGSDGKLSASQIPSALVGVVTYQGTWNASTNSPTIPAAAAGNKGQYYIVGTAGTTNVGGITDWQVGDWIISDGAAWTKVDNTDAGTDAAVVRATALTGLSTATNAVITAADTILSAFGKLQAQVSARLIAAAAIFTGLVTNAWATVFTPTAMAALAIDVTKSNNQKLAINSASTFTFSAAVVAGQMWGVTLKNTTANALVMTIPSSFSIGRQAAITQFILPPNGTLPLTWYSVDGTTHMLSGDPGVQNNYGATTDPTTADDNTKGYEIGSRYIRPSTSKEWVAMSVGTNAAVWVETTAAGGGGGASNLAIGTRTGTTVPVTNDNGNGFTLTAADGTNAGVMAAAMYTKLNNLPDAATLSTSLAGKQADLGLANAAALNSLIDTRAGALDTKVSINAQGGAYTLAASDAGKEVVVTSATPVNVTINQNIFAANDRVIVRQGGAGAVTIVAGTGVTPTKPSARSYSISAQGESAAISFPSANAPHVVAA